MDLHGFSCDFVFVSGYLIVILILFAVLFRERPTTGSQPGATG